MIITAPEKTFNTKCLNIFLAGTISECIGKSDWQLDVAKELDSFLVNIYNPRRKNWDSSWKCEKENSEFNEQVKWELDNIDKADIVCFYFAENSMSPITLLELGLCIGRNRMSYNKQKIIVYCDPSYLRKGNVEITLEKYNLEKYNLEKLISLHQSLIYEENYEKWLEHIKNTMKEKIYEKS